MLSTGWLDAAIGALLLLYGGVRLNGKWLKYLMLIGGVISIALFYIQDVDLYLGLWHGIRGDFDVDGKSFLTASPLLVGLTSTLMGLYLRTNPNRDNAVPKHRT